MPELTVPVLSRCVFVCLHNLFPMASPTLHHGNNRLTGSDATLYNVLYLKWNFGPVKEIIEMVSQCPVLQHAYAFMTSSDSTLAPW